MSRYNVLLHFWLWIAALTFLVFLLKLDLEKAMLDCLYAKCEFHGAGLLHCSNLTFLLDF